MKSDPMSEILLIGSGLILFLPGLLFVVFLVQYGLLR